MCSLYYVCVDIQIHSSHGLLTNYQQLSDLKQTKNYSLTVLEIRNPNQSMGLAMLLPESWGRNFQVLKLYNSSLHSNSYSNSLLLTSPDVPDLMFGFRT